MAKINGTSASEAISGTHRSDKIKGKDGDDTLHGLAGNDKLYGGNGDDSLVGGSGTDKLQGDEGNDTLEGGSGKDDLRGGDGDDSLDGGTGNDKLKGGDGDDVLLGDEGHDKLEGEDGNDRLDGGEGDDTLTGGDGSDTLLGGSGNDVLIGDESGGGSGHHKHRHGSGAAAASTFDDYLDGGSGNDLMLGGAGDDTLLGGSGNDTLLGGVGSDSLLGGSGNDVLIGDSSGSGSGSGGHRGRHGSGSGSGAALAGSFDDYLDGGAGNDFVLGGGGDDEAVYTIAENAGASDDYRGGRGIDTLTLNMTAEEWFQPSVQADVANYLAFLAANTNASSGEANSASFQFTAFDLSAREFENLRVLVDGIELDPTNEAVDAQDDIAGVSEDATAVGFPSVLLNDDVPDIAQSVTLVSGPAAGILVFNQGTPAHPLPAAPFVGSFSFDPNGEFEDLAEGELHDVTFTYEVTDANGDTDQATVTITVTGTNDAPTLAAGVGAAVEDGPTVDVDLTALGADVDSDDDGNSLTYSVSGAPSEGSAIITGGTLTFDPGTDFQNLALNETRDVVVQVTATDAHGATAVNDVTITVTGTNDAPTITAGFGAAVEDGPIVSIDLAPLAGDVDSDDTAATLSYAIPGVPSEGSAVFNGSVLEFNPGSDFKDLAVGETRDVVINTSVTDAHGAVDTSTVTITVTGTNDAPTLAAGVASAVEDGPSVDIDLTALGADVDSDDDGTSLTYTVSGAPSEGTASITGGILTFDPGADFQTLALNETKEVTIQVTATDAHGATAVNDVVVTVTGTNDAPVVDVSSVISGGVVEAGNLDDGAVVGGMPSATGTMMSTDVDTGATATWSGDAAGAYGAFAINPTTGTWTYTLNNANPATNALAEGQTETETFIVTVTDEHNATATETVTITVSGTNDSPVANDVTLMSGPADPTGWTYSADNGHYYQVVDTGSTFAEAQAGADALGGYLATITTANEQAFVEANGLIAVTDGTWIGGQSSNPAKPGAWTWVTGPEAGQSFSFDNWRPTEPNGGFSAPGYAQLLQSGEWNDAPDSLRPGNGNADGYLVEWGGRAQDAGFDEDTVLTIGTAQLLANDTDVDTGAILTVTAVSALSAAGVPVSLNGTNISYDPTVVFNHLAAGESATDTFTYTVTDEFGATDTATVTLTIEGRNDGPVAVADMNAGAAVVEQGFGIAGNDTATGNLLANDSDVDASDVLSVTAVDSGTGEAGSNMPVNPGLVQIVLGRFGSLAIEADGTWTYNLNDADLDTEALAQGATAQEVFTYTVDDGNGGTDTATLSIDITGTNDAPVIGTASVISGGVVEAGNLDDGTVAGGTPAASGTMVSTDVDTGATATWSGNMAGTYGDFAINPTTGVWTYTLNNVAADALAEGQSETETFSVLVTDDQGATATETVTITVEGTNDSPVAVADTAAATVGVPPAANLDAIAINDTAGGGGTFYTQMLTNDGTGMFLNSLTGGPAIRSSDVTLGDFDNDGDLDAFVGVYSGDGQLLLNQGGVQGGTEGVFVTTTIGQGSLPSLGGFRPTYTLDVEAGDVNGDGNLDIVVANWNGQANQLLLGDGAGGFAVSTLAGGSRSTRDIRLGDIDGDGDLDAIATTDQGINQLLVNQGGAQGGGQGSFVATDLPSVLNQFGSLSIGADIGDVNGDGFADVVITNILDQNELLLGDGAGGFTATTLAGGLRQSTSIRLADLDGDGDLDAFVTNNGNQLNQVLINQGGTQGGTEGSFVASDIAGSMRNSASVALVDIDQDGDLDAVVANNSFNTSAVPDQTNQIYLNDGAGNFTLAPLGDGNNPTNSIEFGDLNGDGGVPAVNADGLPNLPLGSPVSSLISGSVAANDGDVDTGASLSYALETAIAGLTLAPDGSYVFDANDPAYSDLAEGESKDFVATYIVTDEFGATAQSTLTITVHGTNDAPTLAAGVGAAVEDGPTVDVDLTALGADVDSDDNGTSLTYTVSVAPSEGSASITGGTLTFDPDTDFQTLALNETRVVTVQVTATDAHGATVVNDVVITVTGTNDGPVATNDSNVSDALVEQGFGIAGDDAATGDVLLNDSDVDTSDVLSVVSVTNGSQTVVPSAPGGSMSIVGTFGSLVLAADGTWDYALDNTDPDTEALESGDTAFDTFTYTVSDGNGGTDTATLTLGISGSGDNVAPVSVDDAITVTEDTPITLDLLGNDTDANNVPVPTQTLSVVSIDGQPIIEGNQYDLANGTLTFEVGGGITYTPHADAVGTDSFTYTISDGLEESNTGTVNLTIDPVNDAPVIAPIMAVEAGFEETIVDVNDGMLGAGSSVGNPGYWYVVDFDAPAGAQTIAIERTSSHPNLSASEIPTNGVVMHINPNNDDFGVAVTSYLDGVATTRPSSEISFPDYDGPVGEIYSAGTLSALGSTNGIAINWVGPNVGVPGGAANVRMSLSGIDYTDGTGSLTLDGVKVQVSPAIMSGQIAFDDPDIGDTHVAVATGVTLSGTTNGLPPALALSMLSLSVSSSPAGGAPGTVDWTFNPGILGLEFLQPGESLTFDFDIEVDDNQPLWDTQTLSITIHGTNDIPVALEATETIPEDGVLNGTIFAYDLDGDVTTISLNVDAANGTVVIDPSTGAYTYTPDPDFNGTDSFSYFVDDGNGGVSGATITIEVTPENDAPTLAEGALAAAEDSGIAVEFDLTTIGDDIDADDDPASLSYAIIGHPVEGVAELNGNILEFETGSDFQDLAEGETREVTVQIQATDAHGETAVNNVIVTVTGTNDGPVAVSDTLVPTNNGQVGIATDRNVQLATLADGNVVAITGNVNGTIVGPDGSSVVSTFQVNDLSTGTPIGPQITELSSGGFAVTWYVNGAGNVGQNIAGRLFQPDGTPVGASFIVNSTVGETDFRYPSVTELDNGNLLWSFSASGIAGDASGQGVKAVVTDTSGSVVVPEFMVNTSTSGSQWQPRSAVLDTGDVVIAWSNDGQVTFGIFDQNGAPQVGEVNVPSSRDVEALLPMDNGQFMIVSQSAQVPFATVFNDDGSIAVPAFQMSQSAGTVLNPQATVLDNGNVVVTWDSIGGPDDTSNTGIRARIFAPDGTPVTDEFGVNTEIAGGQTVPDVTPLDNGGFMIAWWDQNIPYSIEAQVFDANGTPVDGAGLIAANSVTSIDGAALLANDTDVDGDILTIDSVAGSSTLGASLTLNGDGTISYDPGANFVHLSQGEIVADSFTYTVTDGNGGFDTATVAFTVIGENDAPTLAAAAAAAEEDGQAVTVDLSTLGADIDGDDDGTSLIYTVTGAPIEGAASIAGNTLTFDPGSAFQDLALGETRNVVVQVSATDAHGGVATNDFTFTVTGTNDGPIATGDSGAVSEDGTLVASGVVTATDAEGDPFTYTVQGSTTGTYGSITLNATTGAWTYALDNTSAAVQDLVTGQTETDVFVFNVDDGNGGSDTASIAIDVSGQDEILSTNLTTQGVVIGNYNYSSAPGIVFTSVIDSNSDGTPDLPLTPGATTDLPMSTYQYGIAYGDLDGDGDIDLAISANDRILLHFNQGDANSDGVPEFQTLVMATGELGTSAIYDVAIGDFNSDGIDDVVLNGYSTNAQVLFGQGDYNNNGVMDTGDYLAPVVLPSGGTGNYSYGVTVADINGDGYDDIVTNNWSSGPIDLFYGDGAGGFVHDSIEDAYDESALGVAVGDLNGDGHNDMLLSRWNNQDDIIYFNQGDTDGDGTSEFVASVVHTGGYNLESELFDLDGDGDLDIIMSELSQSNPTVLMNDGTGSFTEAAMPAMAGSSNSYGVGVGDIDGDGDIDIVHASINGAHDVYLNQGGVDGAISFTQTTLNNAPASWDIAFINITDDLVFV